MEQSLHMPRGGLGGRELDVGQSRGGSPGTPGERGRGPGRKLGRGCMTTRDTGSQVGAQREDATGSQAQEEAAAEGLHWVCGLDSLSGPGRRGPRMPGDQGRGAPVGPAPSPIRGCWRGGVQYSREQ